ncbi:MAG: glycosyltransferase [Opitutales bacterium]|nr:glycosyltransferase [Opitutales bacterium]
MINHLTHSTDLKTGGVVEAVFRLNACMEEKNKISRIIDDRHFNLDGVTFVIAHGLWQWPGYKAWKNFKKTGVPYVVFPHGMLDSWFKKTYPLKHLKKQFYWWWRQGKILKDAHAVCFTTEEERLLAQKTFFPYQCNEVVTGLGVATPPGDPARQIANFYAQYPQVKTKKILLYLGRFHPKKGVDMLIKSFLRDRRKDEILLLAGPTENPDSFLKGLMEQAGVMENQIIWSGMLEGDLKWGALRAADSLILPSHQENFGMVIAEALSVGTPVLLTDKVNLWREVVDSNAGIVANDDQAGIDQLIQQWRTGAPLCCVKNTVSCFREKLHISKTVDNIISLFQKE